MPYVTSIERLAIEEGREEGIGQRIEQSREQGPLEGIECVLEKRLGARAESIMWEIHQLADMGVWERIQRSAKTTSRPEDLANIWSGGSLS